MASNNNQNGWFSSLGIGFGSSSVTSSSVSTTAVEQTPAIVASSSSTTHQTEMSHFEHLDRTTGSNTLKRNTKIEFTRSDLLQLLSYYEGEFQARDIVIAALKSEKLKEVVNVGRYRPVALNDPYTALLRDMFADGPTAKPPYNDKDIAMLADQQLEVLENLVVQQRRAQLHMANIIRDAELKHKKVIQELEEEKCKHEHDTAQGDDITYGLEMERTRLKQELDLERQARKKLEKELKKQLEVSDEEKVRQKQIVLLLLAERKKIILKYIEERKRSEDLAQILSEEKTRIDTMAEGLEEESKKSLQMEAELEKQVQIFESDKKGLQHAICEQEKRIKELEAELKKTKSEYETLWNHVIPLPNKGMPRNSEEASSVPMTSSVAKVVQPTATVSSVPVSGPTTGIAQSILPGQNLRQTATPVIAPSIGTSTKVGLITSPQTNTIRSHASTALTSTLRAAPAHIPSKTPAHSSTPTNTVQPPPKKGTILGRGLPPPIPPNKPVIVTKQSMPRRPDQAETDKKKPNLPPAGKDSVKTHVTITTGKHEEPAPSSNSSGIEILGQELEDFQQMIVTMAAGNNS